MDSSSFPKMVSDWAEVVVEEAAEAAPQGRRKTSRPILPALLGGPQHRGGASFLIKAEGSQ